ncbi:MAG: cobyrinate a,c-diamide synthase [Pseudomonadota bacterium]
MMESTHNILGGMTPRIMIAGASSGVGKTSVTLAIVVALIKRGIRVQTYKVGPDYLDPTYLTLASGKSCYNLDGWMMGRGHVLELFASTSDGADICVIEGVMGFFDGASASSLEGSSAEIAKWLDIPTLIIINAHGVGRTFGALAKGMADFEPLIPVKGFIANFCGSERHAQLLSQTLMYSNLPDLVGAIPRESMPNIPRRHLGLVTADTELINAGILDALGDTAEANLRLDDIIEIAQSAGPFETPGILPRGTQTFGRGIRLGLAYDAAFHFYYRDNLDILERSGFEIVKFSPIKDRLDLRSLDAIYFGGGYPEEFATDLSSNEAMLREVRNFAELGRPIYAECGGLMYLSKGIETLEGQQFAMVGLLPSWTRMKSRRKALRYVEVSLNKDSLFGSKGDILCGHEFHYSELTNDPLENSPWSPAYTARRKGDRGGTPEGFQKGNILISYVHAHFASRPYSVERFRQVCHEARA